MTYQTLSPWAEVDFSEAKGLCPRPETLKGKTIGMFSHFKEHAPIMLRELEKVLSEKLPETKFAHLQYPKDTREIVKDKEFDPVLKEWLKGVDIVIAAYGDAGSCAMFHAYNTAYIEKLGTPAVMLVKRDLQKPAQRGAAARLVPYLRFVPCDMQDLSLIPVLDEHTLDVHMRPYILPVIDGLIDALTRPVTQEEARPPKQQQDYSKLTFSGDLKEINHIYYKYGWTNGVPIIPPTEEAVEEMLTGTDLPRDHVVGEIPPMLGKATVEKIAINAVMAGCLPTYMPVIIAAAKGMLDPKIHLEGWTCSVSSWAPFITLSGPISRDIGINTKGAILSPYLKPSATITRAIAYIVMNIGGVRPTLEDMSELGHESRFGICIADNEEESPWEPLHTDYGYKKEDSVVTMFWPHEHLCLNASTPQTILDRLCTFEVMGWDPGAAFIISPRAAKVLSDAGWDRQRILDYVVEYNRQPASKVPIRWLIGNNHLPAAVNLPAVPTHTSRRFWSKDHMFIVVGGSNYGHGIAAFTGGGDHGGPSHTKIELPKNWEKLKEKYSDEYPEYINY